MRDTSSDRPLEPAPRRFSTLKIAAFVALIAAAAVAATGILQRAHHEHDLAQWTDAQAIPTVDLVRPTPETKPRLLSLPGNINAWFEAPIYARVPGYLKNWYKDIGAKVKAGDLLAEIDTPDLDQRYDEAKQELNTAVANAKLADVTAKRWQALLPSHSVSQQSVDEKVADAVALQAKVAAAQANVGRLQALESFKRITAPFAGVVTARRTDIGALINVGAGSGPELFAVADVSRMRVYVRVPQSFSAEIQEGQKATLTLPQYPGQTFDATVLTTSNAINPESRTVLVELVAANPDGKLWPGNFATVRFDLPPDSRVMEIPTSALLFQSAGLQVAVVGPDDRVTLKAVRVGRNFGTTVEVLSGITINDRIIDSPPDSILDGQRVRPVEPSPRAATPPSPLRPGETPHR
ncbi:MAG: efflux RND transporter periplasmic adaptor subunit [Alphaproteobacteria bacterium]|nr:efflux RND transporter periplasmic adaptor subunit [Alphaproteobacteria bacterium]